MGYLRCRVVVAKGRGRKGGRDDEEGKWQCKWRQKGKKESPHGARAVHTHTRARTYTRRSTRGSRQLPEIPENPDRTSRHLPTSSFFYVHVVADVRVEMPPLRLLLVHLVAHAQAGRDRLDALPQRHPLGRVVDLAAAAQVETAVLAVEVGHTGGKEGR